MSVRGIDILLELLAGHGVRYLFGNPGTTELPLCDALCAQRRIEYILALQEVPAVAMADGYAQASGGLGVVNVHTCCGLGNAMGMVYNAYRAGTPLLVTAGQQDRRLALEEPILWGDMVAAVRPWTKWAVEVQRLGDLPSAVRRAVQTALSPPTGPVFLALPVDLQMETIDRAKVDMTPPRLPDVEVRPPAEAVRRAASVLAEARRPAILTGSRVCEAGAIDALVAVAERLGAPVLHEPSTSHGRASFPSAHPLCAAPLPLWSPEIHERLVGFDVLLVVGMKLFEQYIYHEPARPLPERIRLVQIDDDPWELGKNYPVEVGLVGHPRSALGELAAALEAAMSPEARAEADLRGEAWARQHAAQRQSLQAEAESQLAARPMTPLGLMESLARVLPSDVAVIEEAPTTTMGSYFERTGALPDPRGYFAQRGWALGWGLGCAVGVRLAWPNRPVLAIIGDGSAMYGVPALWTAAHYRVGVTFVVPNNTEYRILKDCAGVLGLPEASAGRYCGLDVTDPPIDYIQLAESLGVAACRVEEPDALSQSVAEALRADEPSVIEVPVRRPE